MTMMTKLCGVSKDFFFRCTDMVVARNYNIIQTLIHVHDVRPILIDPRIIDQCPLRRNNGDMDNENSEEDDDDLVKKISKHSLDDND